MASPARSERTEAQQRATARLLARNAKEREAEQALEAAELSAKPFGPPERLRKLAETHPWIREVSWRPDVDRVSVRALRGTRNVRVLSVQELAYIDAYLGGGCEVPAESARYAGFADPSAMGHVLYRRLAGVIAQERAIRKQNAIMSPVELLERLSLWARSAGESGSTVGTKAAELLGRMLGMLTDRVDVRLDVAVLRSEIAQALSDPQKLLPPSQDVIEAELVRVSAPAPDQA